MLKFQETSPKYFDEVKSYFADKRNVRKISSDDFEIDKRELDKYFNEFPNVNPNIYALLIKKPNEIEWSLKYIGQRKSKGIKQRLREHLISCNAQTGSQLEQIKLALKERYEVGIILVNVIDSDGEEHSRLLYESMLIKEFSAKLDWNTQK